MWMSVSAAIAASATRDFGETTSGMRGSGIVNSGVEFAAAGMKRPDVLGQGNRTGGNRARKIPRQTMSIR